jgi:hypothetical protein
MLDEQHIQDILDAIFASIEACSELLNKLSCEDADCAVRMTKDLIDLFTVLRGNGYELAKKKSVIKLDGMADNVLYSLEHIAGYIESGNIELALHKIEFELYSILRETYAEFYFWSSVYPDKQKMLNYYNEDLPKLYKFDRIEEAERKGNYKYDLSIFVVGYNKCNYTKLCVQSLLENMPSDIRYELILYNHGSTDETRAFFESVHPNKQFDIKVNGVLHAAAIFAVEGKYLLSVSNDVVVTPNAIINMYRALEEDDRIANIVPSTPNISNLQSIPAPYTDISELMLWAEENNKYDIYRHEQRTRLCNPLAMYRSKSLLSSEGIHFYGRHFTGSDRMTAAFPDDLISMLCRRKGLKNILMKDAYCHHFGSVTINSDLEKKQINQSVMYTNGRRDFADMFGIDPWGTGFCYDPNLVSLVECMNASDGETIEILGINCGHGSNSLKVKELYKEVKHNLNVHLHNVTDDISVEADLRGVSDSVGIVEGAKTVFSSRSIKYHHIVFEDPFKNAANVLSFIPRCLENLTDNGTAFIKLASEAELQRAAKKFDGASNCGNWLRINRQLMN